MNTILFDLDGTLLPMDKSQFLKAYFQELTRTCAPMGYQPDELVQAVMAGISSMAGGGAGTNEARFWDTCARMLGDRIWADQPQIMQFYTNEFHRLKHTTSLNPMAAECVRVLRQKGYQLVLATNPVFPRAATLARMEWAGLSPDDFSLITTYEDSHYCKPDPRYYIEILEKIGKKPEDCLMVGNDVKEDLCAAQLGMNVFLLKDHIIHDGQTDLSEFKQGYMQDLLHFVKQLPALI